MGKLFKFKPLKAPRFDAGPVRLELLKEQKAIGDEMVADFERTVSTWERDKPTFEVKATLTRADGGTLEVILAGSEQGIKKWIWLNFGTSVRYAQLSPDWESKTVPGELDSGSGSGRVVRIDVDNPLPGIEARGWSGIIAEDWRPKYQKRMQAALERGAEKARAK